MNFLEKLGVAATTATIVLPALAKPIVSPESTQDAGYSLDQNKEQDQCNINPSESGGDEQGKINEVKDGASDVKEAQENKDKGDEDRELSTIALNKPIASGGSPIPNRENISNQDIAAQFKDPITASPNVSPEFKVQTDLPSSVKSQDLRLPPNLGEPKTDTYKVPVSPQPSSEVKPDPQNAENADLANSMKKSDSPSPALSEKSESSDSDLA